MSLSPTQSANKPPTLWDWPGWRGLGVAVAIMVVAIPVVVWYVPNDPNPLAETTGKAPVAATSQIRNGSDGALLVDPPKTPPIPIHAFNIEISPPQGQFMRIRFTPNGDEILIQSATGKVVAIQDSQGKKIFPVSKD